MRSVLQHQFQWFLSRREGADSFDILTFMKYKIEILQIILFSSNLHVQDEDLKNENRTIWNGNDSMHDW